MKIVQMLIKKAKKDKRVIALAYFGSYARAEAYRDIDICLFLEPKIYTPEQLSQIRLEYTPEQEDYDLQVFQQLPLYVQKEIIQDAKFIVVINEDKLYDLYFQMFRDLSHYEKIYEEYLEMVAHG